MQEAGVEAGALEIVFAGTDHGLERGVEQDYQRALPLADALDEDVLLAYAMNGAALPVQHGHPVRLVVPGWYGMAHVKWLRGITVVDEPFEGFQNAVAYRLRQGPGATGEPVTRIAPRALLIPPGFPDFLSRERFVHAGTVTLSGRAWSGFAPVIAVEVSTDAGVTWAPAELAKPTADRWAWLPWSYAWTASSGRHVLTARATDADGNTQSVEQQWNWSGFTNNAVQRVPVTVV
jgi:DMSO/TMAO reductase YedYZ molybdopterin-dependent catalytic subunit